MAKNSLNKIITLVCLVVSVFFVVMIYGSLNRVGSQETKLEELNKVKEELSDKKTELTDEVNKLKDPDYAAQYARDHYIFPGEGEQVIKLPEINKE